MTSRRDFLQQVACAFAVAGVGCTVPAAVYAEPEARRDWSTDFIPVTEVCVPVGDGSYMIAHFVVDGSGKNVCVKHDIMPFAPYVAFANDQPVYVDQTWLLSRIQFKERFGGAGELL